MKKHLGEPFGTFDIESLSMLLNRNLVDVAFPVICDVVPWSDKDPAPTFTGIKMTMPRTIIGTNTLSLPPNHQHSFIH